MGGASGRVRPLSLFTRYCDPERDPAQLDEDMEMPATHLDKQAVIGVHLRA
jgi:hypothetical protein